MYVLGAFSHILDFVNFVGYILLFFGIQKISNLQRENWFVFTRKIDNRQLKFSNSYIKFWCIICIFPKFQTIFHKPKNLLYAQSCFLLMQPWFFQFLGLIKFLTQFNFVSIFSIFRLYLKIFFITPIFQVHQYIYIYI